MLSAERHGSCQARANEAAKYACESSTNLVAKCVSRDKVCDMARDCPSGEDESDTLHNCSEFNDPPKSTKYLKACVKQC